MGSTQRQRFQPRQVCGRDHLLYKASAITEPLSDAACSRVRGRGQEALPIIEGLTEDQCQYLGTAKAGDLILIETYARPTEGETDEQESAAQSGSANDEAGGDWGDGQDSVEVVTEGDQGVEGGRTDDDMNAPGWADGAADQPASESGNHDVQVEGADAHEPGEVEDQDENEGKTFMTPVHAA